MLWSLLLKRGRDFPTATVAGILNSRRDRSHFLCLGSSISPPLSPSREREVVYSLIFFFLQLMVCWMIGVRVFSPFDWGLNFIYLLIISWFGNHNCCLVFLSDCFWLLMVVCMGFFFVSFLMSISWFLVQKSKRRRNSDWGNLLFFLFFFSLMRKSFCWNWVLFVGEEILVMLVTEWIIFI